MMGYGGGMAGWGQQGQSAGYGQGAAAGYGQGYGQAAASGYGQSAAAGYGTGYGAAQPQQHQAQAQFQAPQGGELGTTALMTVSGCTHGTVGSIVRGNFMKAGENHGRPTYKKEQKVNGSDVMLYYWDERDGLNVSGWWFGPKVGGDQVWAFQPNRMAKTPPKMGWKVPYDGPVDQTFMIAARGGAQQGGQLGGIAQKMAQPNFQQAGQKGGLAQKLGGMAGSQQAYQQQQMGGQNSHQQQKQLAMQKQQEGLKKQQEAQLALQKQKQEVMKKQQEEAKNKLEEANKKKLEDQQKKMAEMKVKQEESRAAVAIRKVLQKVRIAKADDLETVEKELADEMTKELSKCGSQQAAVKTEVEKAVEQVKARHVQLKEAMQKQEERKAEFAKKQEEAEEKATEIIKEFEDVVAAAEAAMATLKAKSEPLSAEGAELKADQVNKLAKAIDAATEAANEKVKACTEFVKEKASDMKVPEIPGQKPSESKQSLAKLMQRINECTKSKDITVRTATSAKTKALRKAEARKKLDDAMVKLTKFDGNKDGMLEKKEVLAYAKQEFKFTVPEAALGMIFKVLAEAGGKGVKKEHFQRLKVQIGAARERQIDIERKTSREKREAEIEALKVKLTAKVDAVGKSLDEVEESAKKVEEASQPLSETLIVGRQAKVNTMKSGEMVALADEVDEKIKAVREKATSGKAKVTGLKEGVDSDVLVWLGGQVYPLYNRCKGVESRLARLTLAVTRFRDAAKMKDKAEVLALEKKALAMIKYHQKAKSLSAEALFAAMSKKGDQLDKAGFLAFFKSCEKEKVEVEEGKEADAPPTQEDLGRIFKLWEESEVGVVSKDKMLSLTRSLMKVSKDTVLTDGLSIKDSKSIRRLDVGEVVEVLGTPEAEGDVDVKRVSVKAMKDDVEGWVTVSGNQGTVFLLEGGGVFKVVKETIITGSFDLEDSTKDMPRKLKAGELVEAREWPKKEEKTGLVRMRIKAKSDGVTGWVTAVGNTGVVFLEVK